MDAIPAGYKTADRDLNIEIMKASGALFSRTGLFDPATLTTPLTVLSGFDETIGTAKIDLSKTYTNRFAEEAARRLKE